MKYIILTVMLCGCSMSNDEVFKEKDSCIAHEMDYQIIHNGFNYKAISVICIKKEKP